ncbi:MAG: helix-turn-helix transcriptional regulator [Pseudonocardia sp.]|nr:helix-turn-helix transcriptional regulator [Pseudonocardia sp.]
MSELEPRNFIQPCLLLLLRECPDHGYELAARLRPLHNGDGEAGAVYRALRSLERHGLVRSEWQTSDVGPARRTYSITEEGIAYLDARVRDLGHAHEALHVFLDRYARVTNAGRLNGSDAAVRARRGAAGPNGTVKIQASGGG